MWFLLPMLYNKSNILMEKQEVENNKEVSDKTGKRNQESNVYF